MSALRTAVVLVALVGYVSANIRIKHDDHPHHADATKPDRTHHDDPQPAKGEVRAAHSYPLFKQCDPKWGSHVMGGNGQTICQVGCLMSSISMAIKGWGISIDGNSSNPNTLNIWLRNHGGYAGSTSELIEGDIPDINHARIVYPADGHHSTNDLSAAQVNTWLTRPHPRVVIANVNGGSHFVLGVGVSGSNLMVNDPGFERTSYPWSGIVGWRIFDMN